MQNSKQRGNIYIELDGQDVCGDGKGWYNGDETAFRGDMRDNDTVV